MLQQWNRPSVHRGMGHAAPGGRIGSLRAQQPDSALARVGRLETDAVVRATLPGGRTVTGVVSGSGDGRLGIRVPSGATETLTLAQIQTLSVRGRQTRTGALVGGAAGVAAGIFLGFVIGAVCDAAVCDRTTPYLYTIPLVGAGGTLLGAVDRGRGSEVAADLPVRCGLGVLGELLLATPAAAQVTIGEFQLTAGGAAALRPTSHAPADFPPPGGRALAGLTASFSFVHRALSLGPEAMVFRGSDRRMYSLGGVSRLRLARGRVRPYILIGAGFYSWDRKQIPAFDPGLGRRLDRRQDLLHRERRWRSDRRAGTPGARGRRPGPQEPAE